MIPLVAERVDEIGALCREHGVQRLDVFGSAAVGDFDAGSSDLDFLVVFKPDAPRYGWSGNRFDLKWKLEAMFGRKVDLVDFGAIENPYFRASAVASRELVYEA